MADGLYSGNDQIYPEAAQYLTCIESSTFNNLYVFITFNTTGTAATWTLRKNGANTAVSVSIPGTISGGMAFTDTVDSATGANGDGFDYAIAEPGGGGGNSLYTSIANISMASAHTLSAMFGGITNVTVLNYYYPSSWGLAGGAGSFVNTTLLPGATESLVQYIVRTPLHSFNMTVYSVQNTCNGAVSFNMRKNGSNGNQSVSLPASSTGSYSDSVDTDNFSNGDLLNYLFTPSGTSGLVSTTAVNTTSYCTDNFSLFTGINGYGIGAWTPYQGQSVWYAVSGDGAGNFQSESYIQSQILSPATALDMAISLTTTSGSGTTCTVNSRVNGANGNLAISFGSTSGYYEDTIDNDSLSVNALYDLQLTEGSAGTTNFVGYVAPTAMMYMGTIAPPPTISSLPIRINRAYRHHK